MAKTLEEHHGYLSDRVKLAQYQAAIDRLVRPEHVVLDLGCGSGLLGLMALRAGAAKVLFVEEGAIIEVARQTVADAGFAGKGEFFKANSFKLELAERVDVVLCDHVGYFGFDYGILELLADARQRFLKPGGVIVPGEIALKLAPVESETCRKLVGQWQDGSVPDEYSWLATAAANTKHATQLEREDLLAEAETLATLELGAEEPPYLSWSAEFSCERDGMLDGVVGWFDCRLNDDIHMTNSPLTKERLDRPQAFFPLDRPVTVEAGDRILVTVMARHKDHVIGWVVDLPESGKRFTHTTFNGLLLDSEALTRAQQVSRDTSA
jgi:protein arginine N-methyltransferase 1